MKIKESIIKALGGYTEDAVLNLTSLKHMEIRAGEINAQFEGGAARLFAACFISYLKENNVKNYVEFKFTDHKSGIGDVTVTVQKVNGLTPATKIKNLEHSCSILENALLEIKEKIRLHEYETGNASPILNHCEKIARGQLQAFYLTSQGEKSCAE